MWLNWSRGLFEPIVSGLIWESAGGSEAWEVIELFQQPKLLQHAIARSAYCQRLSFKEQHALSRAYNISGYF